MIKILSTFFIIGAILMNVNDAISSEKKIEKMRIIFLLPPLMKIKKLILEISKVRLLSL